MSAAPQMSCEARLLTFAVSFAMGGLAMAVYAYPGFRPDFSGLAVAFGVGFALSAAACWLVHAARISRWMDESAAETSELDLSGVREAAERQSRDGLRQGQVRLRGAVYGPGNDGRRTGRAS